MNKIGWCDVTWNPVTGCTPVSESCTNCYAKRMATRLAGRYGYPADEPFRVTLHPERLLEFAGWRKPRRVFVVSMGDLFHTDVPGDYIAEVFNVMAAGTLDCDKRHFHEDVCWGPSRHTFLLLTKRPKRMLSWFENELPLVDDRWPGDEPLSVAREVSWPLPNVWLGVTAENQARADERIPLLLRTPAAVRFLSCEPLLGPVDLTTCLGALADPPKATFPYGIHWVICGGETGPGARPMRPEWVRSLRDECQAAGVPFWFKGWGGPHHEGWVVDGMLYQGDELDGRVWHERPEVQE